MMRARGVLFPRMWKMCNSFDPFEPFGRRRGILFTGHTRDEEFSFGVRRTLQSEAR